MGKAKIGKNFINLGMIEPFHNEWVTIGDNVLLGGESKIVLHGPIRPYREDPTVVLEDLVWVGFRALILPGTHIRRSSLVGAASLVAGEFPPYSIIAGSPAKVIRRREIGEMLNFFIIRILMNGVLGVTKADWRLLNMSHVKYVLGYGTPTPYDPSIDLDSMTVQDVIEELVEEKYLI